MAGSEGLSVGERIAELRNEVAGWRLTTLVALVGGMLLLIPVNLVAGVLRVVNDVPEDHPLVRLVSFNDEQNIPTVLSVAALLLASISAVHAGRADPTNRRRNWYLAAVIMLYLALDEFFKGHERWGRALFGSDKTFYWVIPAVILALLLAAVNLRWVLGLPSRVRALVFASGFVYVGAAAGLEAISVQFLNEDNSGNVLTGLMGIVEENLEVWGVALFVLAALLFEAQASRAGHGRPAAASVS